jgi:hypothetical protein
MVDTFVHVVCMTLPQEQQTKFAVMFAPVGPTGSGGAMKPHYLVGRDELTRFLGGLGFTDDAILQIQSDLERQGSVSVRTDLARPFVRANFYRLRFAPEPVDAGSQSWSKVKLTGEPFSASANPLSATFHDVDKCLSVVSECLGTPLPQLASIRRSLAHGSTVELGGSHPGVQFFVREDQLVQMGLTQAT